MPHLQARGFHHPLSGVRRTRDAAARAHHPGFLRTGRRGVHQHRQPALAQFCLPARTPRRSHAGLSEGTTAALYPAAATLPPRQRAVFRGRIVHRLDHLLDPTRRASAQAAVGRACSNSGAEPAGLSPYDLGALCAGLRSRDRLEREDADYSHGAGVCSVSILVFYRKHRPLGGQRGLLAPSLRVRVGAVLRRAGSGVGEHVLRRSGIGVRCGG